MKNLLPKKSKKGITLVETVIAVVVLAILTTGILSLMTAGGRKILLLSNEASDQAAAAQQLDLVIAAISNGSEEYIKKVTKGTGSDSISHCYLDLNALKSAVALDGKAQLTVRFALYDGNIIDTLDTNGELKKDPNDSTKQLNYPVKDIRGWYLVLTYKDASAKGVTVEGFVSNSEGVFDQ